MKPADLAAMLLCCLFGPAVVAAFVYRSPWPLVPWLACVVILLYVTRPRPQR